MHAIAKSQSASDRLIESFVLGNRIGHRSGQLEYTFSGRSSGLRHQDCELIWANPRQDIKVPKMGAQRFGQSDHDSTHMSRTGFRGEFIAILELADTEGEGVFTSRSARNFFDESLVEI